MNGMVNGGGQPNFPQQPPSQQSQQQITHMMGNLSMNPSGSGMHQHHPVTYIQQNDANQNIPIYQQR